MRLPYASHCYTGLLPIYARRTVFEGKGHNHGTTIALRPQLASDNQVCPEAASRLRSSHIDCIYIAAIAATKTAPAAIPPNAVACAAPAVLEELDVVVAVHATTEPLEVVVMFGVAVTRTACPDREVPVIVTVVF